MVNCIIEEESPMAKKKNSYSTKSKKAKSPTNGAVSKKIRILKKEGYSQKQAVAIALHLKRKKKI